MQYNILTFSASILYKKIASNTLAQILSKFLTALISIFLIGILTKYLPIELYGSYNKVYNYLGIFAFLADLGLYAIMIREISLGRVKAEKIIWNVLTLRTWLGLCIIGLAYLIALFTPGLQDPLILIAILVVWVFTLISLINSALLALMQSQMKMEFSLFSVVFGKIINISLVAIFLMIVFVWEGAQSLAFISVFVAGLIWVTINTLLNYLYARKIARIRYLFDIAYIQEIFIKALPYGAALFLSVVYFKIDIFLIPFFEPKAQADVSIALYALPMKIVEVLMVLWGFYLNSLLPTLTEKYETKDTRALHWLLWISIKVLLSFWILILALWNLFAYETISIISTPEYLNPAWSIYNSVSALSVVLWVLIFHFLALVFIYMLIASGRQWVLLWINLWVVLINIIWNIIFIPIYSFMWAAAVTLVSQAILMCVCASMVLFRIPLSLKQFWWYGFSLLYAFALFLMFHSFIARDIGAIWQILIYAPIFIVLYAGWEYFYTKKYFLNN